MKLDVGIVRNLNGPGDKDTGIVKDAVDAKAPSSVTGHSVGYLIGSPAIDAGCARIASLVGRIVRNLGLIEINPSAIAAPEDLELLVMLDKQTVNRDIVAIDDESVCAGIAGPTHPRAVVRTPDPGMIHNGVVTIDPQVDSRLP